MSQKYTDSVLAATGATSISRVEPIQELWSGYGGIARYWLDGAAVPSVVVKHVQLPAKKTHPRGWVSDRSHQRKVVSYAVEAAWYRDWSELCGERCYVPRCLALDATGDDTLIVLEDLKVSGFDQVRSSVSLDEVHVCLKWLAWFHATFLGREPDNLWPTGTYWHLETRPDELASLDDASLKQAAAQIDERLSSTPYQTVVHGDAKLANFCFTGDGRRVAAVDFQYAGGGCGMKDVAYFIGSCLDEQQCERFEDQLLNVYFSELATALVSTCKLVDTQALEDDWRALYPFAWTDFHRFLKGWSPGHWKINSYSERIAREVLTSL